jgi:single-strand DNA-binding protein
VKTNNFVQIIGNLGRLPEMSVTPDDTMSIAKFSIAVDQGHMTDKGWVKEESMWVNCVAFGRLAENIGIYSRVGQGLVVLGRLKIRKYTLPSEERARLAVEVICEDVDFFIGQKSAPKQQPEEGQEFGPEEAVANA